MWVTARTRAALFTRVLVTQVMHISTECTWVAGALGIGADLHLPLCTAFPMPNICHQAYSVLVCRYRLRQGGSTGWLLSRHPSLQPHQWRVAACHREVVQSAMLLPLFPWQFPSMHVHRRQRTDHPPPGSPRHSCGTRQTCRSPHSAAWPPVSARTALADAHTLTPGQQAPSNCCATCTCMPGGRGCMQGGRSF